MEIKIDDQLYFSWGDKPHTAPLITRTILTCYYFITLSPYLFSITGLGYASVMVSAVIAIYYAVIIAICLLFLFKSMTSELPWTNCDNPWNTEFCRTLSQTSNSTLINSTMVFSMNNNTITGTQCSYISRQSEWLYLLYPLFSSF